MNDWDQLEFPVWDKPMPPAPPMAPEQYDRFLYETLELPAERCASSYGPVPTSFTLFKEDASNEG
jgi:hypothetical protein